jgi:spore germination cell wall hydrolase CwlJ-like protein
LAKTTAEAYLGSTISSADWTLLVRATFGESTSNQKEQAYVMATILNRVRTNYSNYGTNITAQLYAKLTISSSHRHTRDSRSK